MRLWALLAAALLSTLVLAGCSDDPEDGATVTSTTSSSESTTTSASSSTSTSSSSTSTSSAPQENRAPTGSISASVAGGSLPLEVNFTLAGSDPDGDALTWDLAFGDGQSTSGTTLPGEAMHSYTTAGNFTAVYTLSDGTTDATYDVTVAVTAGTTAAGLTFAGSVQVWCVQCTLAIEAALTAELPTPTPIPSASWNSGEQGEDAVWTAIPADLVGRPFVATTSGVDVGVAMLSECDPTAAVAIELFDSSATPEAGVIPAGTGCILMWDFPPVPPATPSPPAESTLTLVIS